MNVNTVQPTSYVRQLLSDTENEIASVYAVFSESSDLISNRKIANKATNNLN